MNENHEQAKILLTAIWRGIPADYKSRYRRNIWRQFEDNVRSAAYTSNLGEFVNALCSKVQAQIGKTDEEREQAEAVLNSGNDRALLKLMRNETALVVLMVRVENQQRQEEWRARDAERKEEEAAAQLPGEGASDEN